MYNYDYYVGIRLHNGWYLRLLLAVLTSGVKSVFAILLYVLPLLTLLLLCVISMRTSDLKTNMSSEISVLHKKIPLTHDLPWLSGPFIGREQVLSNVTQWLHKDDVMIVAVFGPPAIGKSVLSIHIGYSMLRQNFTVRYIDTVEHECFNGRLSESLDQHTGTISSQLIMQTWQFMLQLYDSAKRVINVEDMVFTEKSNPKLDKWGKLRTWANLLTNNTLLILDNCDNILNNDVDRDEFFQLLEDLIRLSNLNLKVLLTSQIEVKLMDNFVPIHLEGLHPDDSVKLLNKLVQDYGVHMKRQDAERIAELVENLPLALKVIGSILRKHGENSAKLVKVLEQKLLKPLSDRDREKDNFTAIMDIAYARLDYQVQSCSHFLSLLTHSFDKNAAVEILSGCYIECPDCCIDTLLEHSLMEEYWYEYETRLKLYRLIKEYFLIKSSIKDLQTTKDCFKRSYFDYYSGLFTSFASLWSAGELSEEQLHKFRSENHNMEFLINMYEGAGFLTSMPEHTSEKSKVLIGVVFIFSISPTRALSSKLLYEFDSKFWDIYDQVGSQITIVMYLELIRYHCRESRHCCAFWVDYEEHFFKYRLILEAEAAGSLSMFSEQHDYEMLQLLSALGTHYNSCFGATTAFSVVSIAIFVLCFTSVQQRDQILYSICIIVMIVLIIIVWSIEGGGCDQELNCLSTTPTYCYMYPAPQLHFFYSTLGFILGILSLFVLYFFIISAF